LCKRVSAGESDVESRCCSLLAGIKRAGGIKFGAFPACGA
jgi:hypothetical protein